jgi:hypothetical protein
MARSSLTTGGISLVSDTGGVLFPLVQGEQLEFPVSVEFLSNLSGYTYEAVVVEADNTAGQTAVPTAIKVGGTQTTLNVRTPVHRGNWDAPQAYNTNELVSYSGNEYRLKSGAGRISALTPDMDAMWEVTSANTLFVQFPNTLSLNWSQQPTVDTAVYGYFELRVTEPSVHAFPQTWKPVRGAVEVSFSPTQLVP